jgi:hypothetical protein
MRCANYILGFILLATMALAPTRLVAQSSSEPTGGDQAPPAADQAQPAGDQNANTNGLEGTQAPQLDEQAARFGILPSQTAQIQSALQQNSLTADQLRVMCAGVTQRHLSRADVDSAANSLGISGPQLDELKNCTQPLGPDGKPPATKTAKLKGAIEGTAGNAPQMEAVPKPPGEESPIEVSFRRLASPTVKIPGPQPRAARTIRLLAVFHKGLDLCADR